MSLRYEPSSEPLHISAKQSFVGGAQAKVSASNKLLGHAGRLVLGDGVAHATQLLSPDLVIDMATLTGKS